MRYSKLYWPQAELKRVFALASCQLAGLPETGVQGRYFDRFFATKRNKGMLIRRNY
jgi:hypothetical protein